jgi:hypothetical protein
MLWNRRKTAMNFEKVLRWLGESYHGLRRYAN